QWDRVSTMDEALEATLGFVKVMGGMTLAGTLWMQTNTIVTLGTTAQSWTQISGPTGPQGPPGASATISLDTWHNVGSAGEPTYNTGYSTFDVVAGFRKDPQGKVLLRGSVNHPAVGASSSSRIFTLPAGYRPLNITRFIVFESNGQGLVRSETNGDVLLFNPTGYTAAGAAGIVSLDEIEFDTETVTTVGAGPSGPPGGASVPLAIGDGATRVFTIPHNLGSQEVN